MSIQQRFSPATFGVSQPVRRVEDDRLVTGHGRYVDDIVLPDQAYGLVLRSPIAHGTLRRLDVAKAQTVPGVLCLLTGEALETAGLNAIPAAPAPVKVQLSGEPVDNPKRPVLALERVRHIGEAIAFIVAESRDQAEAALALIEFDIDPEPAVTDQLAASQPTAPLVYPERANNIALSWQKGEDEAIEAAFANAHRTITLALENNRVVVNSLEPRAVNCRYHSDDEHWELYFNGQNVWHLQGVIAQIFGVDKERFHVITPDVGGGFGMKMFTYPEHILCAEASRRIGRPVKWSASRSESFLCDTQGRAHHTTARLALDDQHRILALDIETYANLGAYLSYFARFIPTAAASKVIPGVYKIPAVRNRVHCLFTHTPPVDAYRGAGRPESIYMIERLMDAAAFDLDVDPSELRRRNFISASDMPYTTAFGEVIDSGDFERLMDECLAAADLAGFNERRRRSQRVGERRGIGMSYYIESTLGANAESSSIEFCDDGMVEVVVGIQSNGQGHETTIKQQLCQELGIPFDKIRYVQGDSRRKPSGGGTGGSRSLQAQGLANREAIKQVIVKAKALAAERFEVAEAQVVFEQGELFVPQSNHKIDLLTLGCSAPDRLNTLADTTAYRTSWPNGCHIAEVVVDPQTGQARVCRYTVVDDFGRLFNPMIVEGQVHGGVAQGIGQALYERTLYNDEGQLLTGSLMDYALPRADDLPPIDFNYIEIPCQSNELGVKGCGEAGSVAAPAAVINALCNALGMRHVDMPATPERLWRQLQANA